MTPRTLVRELRTLADALRFNTRPAYEVSWQLRALALEYEQATESPNDQLPTTNTRRTETPCRTTS